MLNNKLAFRLFAIPGDFPATGAVANCTQRPGAAASAYIEPGLLAVRSGEVSIILTAGSAQAAARVRQAGGRVTSELWLIDAVSAEIPAQAINRLSHQAGVASC